MQEAAFALGDRWGNEDGRERTASYCMRTRQRVCWCSVYSVKDVTLFPRILHSSEGANKHLSYLTFCSYGVQKTYSEACYNQSRYSVRKEARDSRNVQWRYMS